jgi:hypothetical protein
VKFFLLEIGHIGYQKIENCMLISKMQTYLSDKMLPKKVKIKKQKKWDLANLEFSFITHIVPSGCFRPLIFTNF